MPPSRPLQIAHVTGESGFSGGEVQLFLLLEGLRRRGDRVSLICPPGSRAESEARRRGIELHTVPMGNDLSLRAVLRARRELRTARPDLVHLHTGRANWIGGLAAWSLGIPVITTRRMDREVKPGPRTRFLYDRIARRAVAISPAVRELLRAGGVAEARIRLISSAVDVDALRPRVARSEMRRSLGGVGDNAVFALVLAALVRRKGIDVLLEAFARPRLRAAPLRLWIAGDGPERAALERRARDGGVDARFTGHLERAALDPLYREAGVVVLAARRGEGLPNVLLEAMAHGRPVIATPCAGTRDLLVDGVNGLSVPPDDVAALALALGALRAGRSLATRLAAAARTTAEAHEWSCVEPRLEAVLERWRRR
jgi:glycosyltransferase involved in cell wall biosynthesis